MRCSCCDKKLSDYESTLKHNESGDFLDMCTKCLEGLSIKSKGNTGLISPHEVDLDDVYYDENFEPYLDDLFDEPSITEDE